MEELTGYHAKFHELQQELIKHGWGEIVLRISSMKDNKVKVEVLCGKSFVFFVKKELQFDENII